MISDFSKIEGKRDVFIGTFEKLDTKAEWIRNTQTVIFLVDIKNKDGNIISKHSQIDLTKGFEKLHLKKGDVVQFSAMVKDYKFTRPTRIIRL
jgi:hypothetical protein